MALGDPYATVAEFKERIAVNDSQDDSLLSAALDAASRSVEEFCDRQFNQASAASDRVYRPDFADMVQVDDFTGSATVTAAGGKTLAEGTDFEIGPVRDTNLGKPAWVLRHLKGGFGVNERLTVNALWGWDSVPAQVKEATLIMAAEIFKLKDAPFGVAGFGEFGVVRVRDNPKAAALLYPLRPTGPRVL